MAMSAEHRSRFAALHQQWWKHEWKILEWDEKPQTNKQTTWSLKIYHLILVQNYAHNLDQNSDLYSSE